MLLAALDFCLHAAASQLPLAEEGGRLLVAPLVRQLLVLELEPELLQLLLLMLALVRRREVRVVIRTALESIGRRVFDLLIGVRVERLERWPVGSTLRL